MQETTIGQLLLNEVLPPDMRDNNRVLDKKGVQKLMDEIARKHPEKYPEIVKNLSDIGRRFAYKSGGYGFGLKSLRQTNAARAARAALTHELQQVYSNKNLTPAQMDAAVLATVGKYQKTLSADVFAEAVKGNNPLAMQAVSGARGNPTNVNSLIGSDLLYEDHRGKPVPIPILRNYSMGLSPAEHFAGAFGARKGTLDLKQATADAGFLSKQLSQAVHRLIVTARDDDNPYDESQPRGMEVATDDADNEGAVLAHPVGDYKRNTLLTPKILKDIKAAGHDNILVRSPTVGGPQDGGVYAMDAGYREKGRLPPLGDMIGLAGSHAISEPLTQGQISSKHCLKRGTLVRMADWTVKAIEDIRAGDWVLGADKAGITFPVRVVRVFDNGPRECVSTFFKYPFNRAKNGITLESTVDHKVLMQRKVTNSLQEHRNQELQILPVGTPTGSLCAVLPDGYRQEGGVNEPFAIMAGLLLGDGCYTEAVDSVNFSCFDDLLASDTAVIERLASLNLKLSRLAGHNGYYKVSMITDDQSAYKDARGRVLPLTRNPARQWLERRDMFGKYAYEKTLPPDIGTWDIKSICELIGGYFVTDGSVFYPTDHAHRGKPYFSFGSTSEAMLLQLRELFVQRFGIYPTGPYGSDSGGRKRTMYTLNINAEDSIRKFYAAIPLYGIKKQRAAAMMAGWVVESPRKYYRLPRAKPVAIGVHPTHDIEVDHPDHLFVLANGLIVSNSGGVAGASAGAIGGFAAINAMAQAPKTFQGGAVHSQVDGKVDNIMDAPQGGQYLTIGGERHYIPRDNPATVKVGDIVEAGDTLTAGIPNPSEIVKHKGVGEGRRYFVNALRDVLRSSQIPAHRRNVELLSRGLLNHVRLTDEVGDWGPDDVIPYQLLESQWRPRAGYLVAPPKSLAGKYLERPILHYSVGTQIKPSVIKKMEQYGIKSVYAHPEAPPFEPEMVRAMMNTAHDPDWQTKMLGSYQQGSVLEAARRGGVSDAGGTSYVPALAGSETFGATGPTKGWNPADIGRPSVDLTQRPKITSILD